MARIDLIQIRGGTASEWATENPILANREMGLEMDTGGTKFGDGLTAWNDLPYATNHDVPVVLEPVAPWSISLDFQRSSLYELVLSDDIDGTPEDLVFATPTNITPGQRLTVWFRTNQTRSIVYPAGWNWMWYPGSREAKIITLASNHIGVLNLYSLGTTDNDIVAESFFAIIPS